MAIGNRGFADAVASGVGQEGGARSTLPPRTGVLAARNNRLSELASRQTVMREHEQVDPSRCCIWEGHNRDYGALNETTCSDLIESFTAQGRQEVPAIVRRIKDRETFEFEVVCGARRHWTATWMREHSHPDFKFLVEPRELSDEEAFRIADLENRSRRDLSDIERARDYLRALDLYYGANQGRMAQRLEASQSWLSRYLELARLPGAVIEAFGSPHVIKIGHAAVLAPLLRHPMQASKLLAAAAEIGTEQAARKGQGVTLLAPAAVVQRLRSVSGSARNDGPVRVRPEYTVRGPAGDIIARGQRTPRGGGITISLPDATGLDRSELLRAIREVLENLILSKDQTDAKGTKWAQGRLKKEATR